MKEMWINVSEKLPTEGKDVLAYIKSLDKTIVAYYYEGYWHDTIPKIGDPFWKVTHWKELPNNPK